MSAYLLTPSSSEPLALDDAKRFLRVEHDDDDLTIAALISAARHHVEAHTRRALMTQTWRFIRDQWPEDGRLMLNRAPAIAVAAARLIDSSGAATDIDPEIFVVDKAAAIIAAPSWSLPAPGRMRGGIELDVQLGYGASANAVPDLLKQAIRMLVTHWYENRSLVAIGQSISMMPATVTAMLSTFRVMGL